MPRVTLTEKQKDRDRLTENLRTLQGRRSPKEMALILGRNRTTYYKRLSEPEKLTYEEIKRLCDFFKVDMQNFVCGQLKIW